MTPDSHYEGTRDMYPSPYNIDSPDSTIVNGRPQTTIDWNRGDYISNSLLEDFVCNQEPRPDNTTKYAQAPAAKKIPFGLSAVKGTLASILHRLGPTRQTSKALGLKDPVRIPNTRADLEHHQNLVKKQLENPNAAQRRRVSTPYSRHMIEESKRFNKWFQDKALEMEAVPRLTVDDGYVRPSPIANMKDVTIKDIEAKVDEFARRIGYAETGSVDDPWIRTLARKTPGGSTAYGPYQITGGLSKGYMKNKPEIFSDEQLKYLQNMITQSEASAAFGNEPNLNYHQRLSDYGGRGMIADSVEDMRRYDEVARVMMADHIINAKGNLLEAAAAWRGVPLDKDTAYRTRYNSAPDNYNPIRYR